jgi:signal transduction histidine kinase/FixJ family two-component response regulator
LVWFSLPGPLRWRNTRGADGGADGMVQSLLLVDDEDGIRRVVAITLEDMGYRVFTAANGEEALRVFRETHPPIVITDIRMPVLDGIGLLRAVKQESPDTEVIMITGHGDLDMAIESLKLSAADFINKPVSPEVLEIAIRRATERIEMRAKMREYTTNLERLVQEQAARLVDYERQQAAGQVMEGLAQALQGLARDFSGDIRFYNDLPSFVSLHDRQGRVLSVNRHYRERLGDKTGSSSACVYRDWAAHPEGSPVARTLATGQAQHSREVVLCVNGNEHQVMVHTVPIRGGGTEVELVLEIAGDVGEVQRLQEELRATQQLYRQLFEEAPCSIALVNPDLTIAAANRRFRRDFGEQGGALCHRACHGRGDPCPECPALRTFKDGLQHRLETQFLTLDGSRVNALVWTAPIRDAHDQVVQVLELATDITEVRRLQEHLTSLGMLIASLSHGIKGLLTALDGAMYKVNSGLAKNDQTRLTEGWEATTQLVGRIKGMVMDILFWARKRDLSLQDMATSALLEDVARSAQAKAEKAGVRFLRELSGDLGRLSADPSVLTPALVNLLENAVDACAMDTAKTDHQVVLRAFRQADELVVEVEDNGQGMDRETVDKLFSVFFSTKGSKGTGLGLFIAKKAVDQHGGDIQACSEPGKGSLFRVLLPLADAGS